MKSVQVRSRPYPFESTKLRLPRTLRQMSSQASPDDCTLTSEFRVQTSTTIGEGVYGTVQTACKQQTDTSHPPDCEYVAKRVVFSGEDEESLANARLVFVGESVVAFDLGKRGIGVPCHGYFLCQGGDVGVLYMDKWGVSLDKATFDLTPKDITTLLNLIFRMHNRGVLHRDLFLKNIMCKTVNDQRLFRFIDFGLSIVWEKTIPGYFRAIDYWNFIEYLPEQLQAHAIQTIADKHWVHPKDMDLCRQWLDTHSTTCATEFQLLKELPSHLFEIYGSGVDSLLLWSVYCSEEMQRELARRIRKARRAHED